METASWDGSSMMENGLPGTAISAVHYIRIKTSGDVARRLLIAAMSQLDVLVEA
jgi:hypothetical protein